MGREPSTTIEHPPRHGIVLSSKLRSPRLHPDAIERPALTDRLKAAENVPCVVVSGGAGFGKTTAVRQWVEHDTRPAAWVSLDRGDDDPVVLLHHIVAAIDMIHPLPDVDPAFATLRAPVEDIVLPLIGVALEQSSGSFVLVLDDVHNITDPQAAETLDRLIDLLPDGSQLVLSGRSVPHVHLARRLLDGRAVEITQSMLAFTEEESQEVLVGSLPHLSSKTRSMLADQSDGWPAGLHLSVLALQDHPDPESVVTALGSTNQRVAQYLQEELLQHLSDEAHEFLVRTSVLDQLCGALCDATLETTGSGELLRQLADSGNLFIVALDDEPDWFRYHHLFAELLLSRLRRDAPGLETGLRRRAATWLGEHGQGVAAVDQAIASRDVDVAAAALHRELFATVTSGQIAQLERWVEAFPPDEIRRHGSLALAAGWLSFTRGQMEALDHWLAVLESFDEPGSLPDGTVSFDVGRASLVMITGRGGVKRTIGSAALVRDAGPGGSPWWELACMLEAVATHAAGTDADQVEMFTGIEVATRGSDPTHAVALAHLAMAHFARDDECGHEMSLRAVDELNAANLGEYALACLVHAVAALSAARRGDRVGSVRAARVAIDQVESVNDSNTRTAIHVRLILADAACSLGEYPDAATYLDRAVELLELEPDALALHDWADRLTVRMAAATRARDGGASLDVSAAEMRVLRELPTHRSLEEIGQHLYVSRNTVKSHTISIYRKLGVSSRSAAVERGRELGLLPD